MPYLFNKGFTLVEILIAITIISIIAVIGIPNLRKFNQDQDFQKDAAEVIRTFRKAQASSQSSIVCPSSATATSEWRVIISTDKKSLNLVAVCQNGSTETIENLTFTQSSEFNKIYTNNGQCDFTKTQTTIGFINQDKSVQLNADQSCMSPEPNKIEIYITNLRNTSERLGIVVNKGGMVSQCEIDSTTARCK